MCTIDVSISLRKYHRPHITYVTCTCINGCYFWVQDEHEQTLVMSGQCYTLHFTQINLASQSVLEGLNAVLDHRGEAFIPELGMVFHVKTSTKFFACQNPMQQGGGRKGLPKSFLNRFTMVYIYSCLCILYILVYFAFQYIVVVILCLYCDIIIYNYKENCPHYPTF